MFGPFSVPFSELGSAPFGASLFVGVGAEYRCSEVSYYFLVYVSLAVVVMVIQYMKFFLRAIGL